MPPADTAALKAALLGWSRNVMDTATEAMPDQMRPYAPIGEGGDGREPGQLRASIRVVPGPDLSASTFRRIIADVIQAETTDQGAAPHIIRSKRAHGLLVFQIGSQTVFTSKPVHHPGNRARPWWRRALNATWGPNLRYASLRTPFGSPR